jgi:uncharacterized protein with beta-barrel porin domain
VSRRTRSHDAFDPSKSQGCATRRNATRWASGCHNASQHQLDVALRLGWQHEYASTARPLTAAFSGAPSASFTVYAATPTRDAAIVGFSAGTSIAEATQLYLRYDGMLGSGTDNHAITAGLRLSW